MLGTHIWSHINDRISEALCRLFPDRQLMLRSEGRVYFVTFSKRFQLSAIAVALAFVGWSAFTSISYVFYDQFLESKDNQIANTRLAYRSLLSQVASYQRKFTYITSDLESNHFMMLGLVKKNASLQQNLTTISAKLKHTELERESILAVRQNLREKLTDSEGEVRVLNSQNFALKDNLGIVESDLQNALGERNEAMYKGTRMRRQIKDLDNRLVGLERSEQNTVLQLTERTIDLNGSMQRVVKIAGIDPEKILKVNSDFPKGQGGPFIAAKPDGKPASKLKASLSDLEKHLLQ